MEQHFEALYPENTRFAEIEKLTRFIKDGKSTQLLSIPGAGRSLVLNLLAHNSKVRKKHLASHYENTHFVLVNFQEVRNRPLHETTKFIFLSICDSLRTRKMDEYKKINDMFRDALKLDDKLVLFHGLKEAVKYLSLEKKLNIVFLFDRFEEYVPTVTSEFFGNLRVLRAIAKYKFCVVFSLNRPLEEALEPSLLSDFYEFVSGNYVYLSITDKVTADFRVSYIEKITGKKISQPLLQKILKETGGLGRLVKLSAEAVLGNSKASSEKDIDKFLFSQKPIQGALVDICKSLNPSEQQALISNKFEDEHSFSYLNSVGLLADNKVQIPLFEQHIVSHRTQPLASQKIFFEEKTNTIKKADSTLSDKLTSSEFKLLKFLLQNPDRVIDREDIISVVWTDIKSTAGITDQAVDQLIFRLRRKVEEDPNKPSNIITVKGRGFRFEP